MARGEWVTRAVLRLTVGTLAVAPLLAVTASVDSHAWNAGWRRVSASNVAGWRVPVPETVLPLHFEPTDGSATSAGLYLARGAGYVVTLFPEAVTVRVLAKGRAPGGPAGGAGATTERPASVTLHLLDADPHPPLQPERLEAGVSNYFLGNDPSRWRRHVAHYGAVRYRHVYPGIDWLVYGHRGELEHDFVVAPGADPDRIRVRIDGAARLTVEPGGDLLIEAAGQVVRQRRPVVYQESAAGRREYLEGHYVLDHRDVRVALGSYDPHRELVIDPALAFSTYLGGSNSDYATGIAVDGQGNVYVAGVTDSTDFPTLNPYQNTNPGQTAFISKLNAAGTGLIYSTFLGSVSALAAGLIVDGAGNVYIAGDTTSPNFPVLNAFQPTYKAVGEGDENGFFTKLDATGDMLVYSSYLGGSDINLVHGLALDGGGSLYLAGETSSPDFPTANALQPTLKGRINAFVTKLSADGSSLVYSTYLGGSAADAVEAIALDASGNAYVGGNTNSVDFPTVNAFQTVNHASVNGSTNPTGIVAKLSAAGSALLYSSYLGGSSEDSVYAIAVDTSGNAYVAGSTASTDFPTVNPLQSTNKAVTGMGGNTGFISKVNGTGDALVYSTYLGGSGGGNGVLGDALVASALDGNGDMFVAGGSSSTDYPTTNAVQTTNKAAAIGATNAVVSELNASGSALVFSTYLGGSGSYGNQQTRPPLPLGDSAAAIVVDGSGNIYIAGQTESSDFPTLNAYQPMNKTTTQYGSNTTAFVSKFGTEVDLPLPTTLGGGGRGGGGALGWDSLLGLAFALLANRRGRANLGGSAF